MDTAPCTDLAARIHCLHTDLFTRTALPTLIDWIFKKGQPIRNSHVGTQGSRSGEAFRQVYRSSVPENELFDDEGLEVELASPWRRIAAFILNVALLFVFSIIIGFFLGFLGINIAGGIRYCLVTHSSWYICSAKQY